MHATAMTLIPTTAQSAFLPALAFPASTPDAARGLAAAAPALTIDFMDEAARLPDHFERLVAGLDAAAAAGAGQCEIKAGPVAPYRRGDLRSIRRRQRDWLARAGAAARDRGLVLTVKPGFSADPEWCVLPPSRLAQDLALIADPHVLAALDLSETLLRLSIEGRSGEAASEVAALAPHVRALFAHYSFGRWEDFGDGGPHVAPALMPVGRSDIPWADILSSCRFPPGTVLTAVIPRRHAFAAADCLEHAHAFAAAAEPLLAVAVSG